MDHATQWYLDHELRQVQSRCSMAKLQMHHASTLGELVQAQHIHVPSFVHALVRSDLAQVQHLLEQRATELIDAQLRELQALPLAERKAAMGRLQRHDWNCLRGHLPQHYRRVEREAAKLLHTP